MFHTATPPRTFCHAPGNSPGFPTALWNPFGDGLGSHLLHASAMQSFVGGTRWTCSPCDLRLECSHWGCLIYGAPTAAFWHPEHQPSENTAIHPDQKHHLLRKKHDEYPMEVPNPAVPTAQDTALLTKTACLLSNLWLSNRGKTDPEHD